MCARVGDCVRTCMCVSVTNFYSNKGACFDLDMEACAATLHRKEGAVWGGWAIQGELGPRVDCSAGRGTQGSLQRG